MARSLSLTSRRQVKTTKILTLRAKPENSLLGWRGPSVGDRRGPAIRAPASERSALVNDFLDPPKPVDSSCEVLPEETFRHSLAKETSRATRYQDFFSVCLIKPDPSEASANGAGELQQAVSRKIAELLRSTDVVGHVQDGTAVLLLHTASTEARRVAERIRANLENVAFPITPGTSARRITLSVGEVSFPRDGYNDKVLLARAQAHLHEASRRGGDQVVHAEDLFR
jgi:diguanylate cyclase (GGDEF)-like protein